MPVKELFTAFSDSTVSQVDLVDVRQRFALPVDDNRFDVAFACTISDRSLSDRAEEDDLSELRRAIESSTDTIPYDVFRNRLNLD